VLPTAAGPDRESLEGLALREYVCPTCATLLDVQVAFADDPGLHDRIERWPVSEAVPT
jgi:acetone carboxylase gamma subunit